MKYFSGSYAHSLDDRGRLAIPSRLRERLGDALVVTKGRERYLVVYPAADWDAQVEQVLAVPAFDAAAIDLRLSIFADASDCDVDKQGRILIPASLREFAGIAENVTIVGAGDHVQIWDCNAWEIKSKALAERPPDMVYRPRTSGRSS
jgi:MraZ protein